VCFLYLDNLLYGCLNCLCVSQVSLSYRPVIDSTLDDDVEMVPPKLRVY